LATVTWWLADGQAGHVAVVCEGGDRGQIGRLHRTVVAADVFGAGVPPVLVAVGGVVLGHPKGVRQQHVDHRCRSSLLAQPHSTPAGSGYPVAIR
jgi:hypothetical protein